LSSCGEHLDDTIKTKDDLQQASQGTSVLGLIPSVESWKGLDQ
jgi:capsular polysaccharide biosynthesis protein